MLTNLELTARFPQSAIDRAIAGLVGNGCEGITCDMIADYIANDTTLTLADMLATMDIPKQRESDIRWLLRNLAIRNANNVHFAAAMKLIVASLRA